MKTVQARLGHSSILMTADVYGHLFPTRRRRKVRSAEQEKPDPRLDVTQT